MVFPRCRAIHTFAMFGLVDVLFVDASGRVLRVVHRAKPWRVERVGAASTVIELQPGLAASLGISAGSVIQLTCSQKLIARPPGHHLRGSAMLEFFLASTLVILPLISGILEFAQLATARHLLAMAASEAARTLAVATMDARAAGDRDREGSAAYESSVRVSLARGLLPLFGGAYADTLDAASGLERWRLAASEVLRPDRLKVSVTEGVVRTRDVEIGRLEIIYCRELFFAPARYVLPTMLRQWDEDPFSRLCFDQGRVPVAVNSPVSLSRYP